jgi:methionine-S-sulfoxide reductase
MRHVTSWKISIVILAVFAGFAAWRALGTGGTTKGRPMTSETELLAGNGHELITLGGGCFWCLEAIFDELDGVLAAESGYSGGKVPNPGYKMVCTGATGHAEVVQIAFDPKVISLHDLLTVFFTIHDPTTKDRQGHDVGTQYRSIVLYRNDAQLAEAKKVIAEIEAKKLWNAPIVTELAKFETFWPAEDYHQEYWVNNPNQGYCRVVIEPKVAKFRAEFSAKLKKKVAAN